MSMDLPFLPNFVLPNCFSAEDIQQMDTILAESQKVEENYHEWPGPKYQKLISTKYRFDFHSPNPVSELIWKRIPNELLDHAIIPTSYKLHAVLPGELHNDYEYAKCNDSEVGWYIYLVPFETYPTNTVVIDQWGLKTHWIDYKANNQPIPVDQQVPEELYKKYFSHCWPQEREYITIKEIFPWQAGSLIVIDMRYFHSSDNFLANGMTIKKSLTMMTKIPRDKFLSQYSKVIDRFAGLAQG